MSRPTWAPDDVDVDLVSPARVYDYLLGGACNFASDRDFAHKLLESNPNAARAAMCNRAFLHRAVQFCVAEGVDQFLDIGSGIPTVGNVHEVAPAARVVYVDSEPVAVAHGEIILDGVDRAGVVHADLADAEAVLTAPLTTKLLDFDRPIGLLMTSVQPFAPDEPRPLSVDRYVGALPPGGFLVLSHPVGVSTYDQIAAFFAGTEVVEPGVVYTSQWRLDAPPEDDAASAMLYAGVGRKR